MFACLIENYCHGFMISHVFSDPHDIEQNR